MHKNLQTQTSPFSDSDAPKKKLGTKRFNSAPVRVALGFATRWVTASGFVSTHEMTSFPLVFQYKLCTFVLYIQTDCTCTVQYYCTVQYSVYIVLYSTVLYGSQDKHATAADPKIYTQL